MLVLSRNATQAVVVASKDGQSCLLKITVLEIRGGQVRLGFEADADVPVHRLEVWQRLLARQDGPHLLDVDRPVAGPMGRSAQLD